MHFPRSYNALFSISTGLTVLQDSVCHQFSVCSFLDPEGWCRNSFSLCIGSKATLNSPRCYIQLFCISTSWTVFQNSVWSQFSSSSFLYFGDWCIRFLKWYSDRLHSQNKVLNLSITLKFSSKKSRRYRWRWVLFIDIYIQFNITWVSWNKKNASWRTRACNP